MDSRSTEIDCGCIEVTQLPPVLVVAHLFHY